MNVRTIAGFALVGGALVAGTIGCGGGEAPAGGEERIGAVQLRQINYGSYQIKQLGSTVGAAWKGDLVGNPGVEYWVRKTSYDRGTDRTFTGQAGTCSSFRSAVCGTGWSGATYYRSDYVQTALDCEDRPVEVTPPTGAESFFANGSYEGVEGSSGFSWTFVSSNMEYWAMDNEIDPAHTTDQLVMDPGYEDLTDLLDHVCGMSTPPALWFAATYVEMEDFCSTDPC